MINVVDGRRTTSGSFDVRKRKLGLLRHNVPYVGTTAIGTKVIEYIQHDTHQEKSSSRLQHVRHPDASLGVRVDTDSPPEIRMTAWPQRPHDAVDQKGAVEVGVLEMEGKWLEEEPLGET